MKFKLFRKGNITSRFADPTYTKEVGFQHNGIDHSLGFGSLVKMDNIGWAYKVITPGYRKDNWSAAYFLCPYQDHFIEVVLGHLSQIYVVEGQMVREDAIIGREGNNGLIYFGGVQITPAMQRAGDRRGSHVHEGYRPVKRMKDVKKTRHYLRTRDDQLYRDVQGYAYEIIETNAVNGWIDPFLFVEKMPSDGIAEAKRLRSDLNENGILDKLRRLLRKLAL